MAIKIAAWNIEGRLGGYAVHGRGTAQHILQGIAALDADLLVVPELYANSLTENAEAQLEKLGYTIFQTPYDDADRTIGKWGPVGIGVLSRLPVDHMEVIRPGGVRNLITCHVTDPESGEKVNVFATHLDDRSEAQRLMQVDDLVGYMKRTDGPTVMLGDFNAMWHTGRARLVGSRAARLFARLVPHEEFRDVLLRATDMATGSVLKKIVLETNLRDADPHHHSTATPKQRDMLFMPSVCLIQIDHLLISPEVKVADFTVAKDGGSDHRAISATISLR